METAGTVSLKDIFQPLSSLTLVSSTIGLDMGRGNPAVLNLQSVSLAPRSSEDRGPIKVELKSFGESRAWVAQEANLQIMSQCLYPLLESCCRPNPPLVPP